MDVTIEANDPPELELQQAYLVYGSGQGHSLVTHHRVQDNRVLPGRMVERPAFIGNRHSYWFQAGDIYRSHKVYIFTTPAQVKVQHFSSNRRVWSEEERHPQYMWAVGDGNLHVWRFRRYKDDYILLSPRLWNVSDNGSVCTGSMPKPKLSDGRKAMEDFWGSAFSHSASTNNKYKQRLSKWIANGK